MKRFNRKNSINSSTAVKTSTGGSRVVQVSFDVELPDGVDAQQFIDDVGDMVGSATVNEYHIAGSDITEDLTSMYEKNYPELLVYR